MNQESANQQTTATASEPAAAMALGAAATAAVPQPGQQLALDGAWHTNSPRYLHVKVAIVGAGWLLAAIAALIVAASIRWNWIPLVALAVIIVWGTWLTCTQPRRVRAIGYALRADDILFKHGLWWRRIVAVPYGRLQLVDVGKGPIDRLIGVSRVHLITAAATADAVVPGLDDANAVLLRDTLVALAETRRAGL